MISEHNWFVSKSQPFCCFITIFLNETLFQKFGVFKKVLNMFGHCNHSGEKNSKEICEDDVTDDLFNYS